jgi:hypothetical protein
MMNEIPKTITVPEAGWSYFGLSRNASYAAAKNGVIPTIKVGRLLRVPIVAMERMLASATPSPEHGHTSRPNDAALTTLPISRNPVQKPAHVAHPAPPTRPRPPPGRSRSRTMIAGEVT